MKLTLAIVLLCLMSIAVQAKQSPYPVTPFEGDRYGARQAQMGADVAKEAQRQRAAKTRRAAPTRRHALPRARQRMRQVPIFAPLAEPQGASVAFGEGIRRVAAQIIGGRPQGCPSRFCGCALALKIFGRIVPVLNLAVNWVHKFQRTPPAPGMVAARHGHAFQLIAHVRGMTWQVWDANSGRGRIRVHERSIAGFIIVNPRSNS